MLERLFNYSSVQTFRIFCELSFYDTLNARLIASEFAGNALQASFKVHFVKSFEAFQALQKV